MAATRRTGSHVALGNATLAQVNAGYAIVPGDGDRTFAVNDAWIRVKGSQALACTSIDIQDTAGVAAVAFPVALLVADAYLRAGDATVVVTNAVQGLTTGEGLQIKKTGSATTGASGGVDYCVTYTHTG